MATLAANSISATWWPRLELMQVTPPVQKRLKVFDHIHTCCAGNEITAEELFKFDFWAMSIFSIVVSWRTLYEINSAEKKKIIQVLNSIPCWVRCASGNVLFLVSIFDCNFLDTLRRHCSRAMAEKASKSGLVRKSENITDWPTHWLTGVTARRCYRI